MELNNSKSEIPDIDGSKLNIAIILPYFNDELGIPLLDNCVEELVNNYVKPENISIRRVAGTLEIPYTSKILIKEKSPDVIIALGVVIRGETSHYDLVCQTTFTGLMQLQVEHETPIIFGIITCDTVEQAQARIDKNGMNKGAQSARAALLQTL